MDQDIDGAGRALPGADRHKRRSQHFNTTHSSTNLSPPTSPRDTSGATTATTTSSPRQKPNVSRRPQFSARKPQPVSARPAKATIESFEALASAMQRAGKEERPALLRTLTGMLFELPEDGQLERFEQLWLIAQGLKKDEHLSDWAGEVLARYNGARNSRARDTDSDDDNVGSVPDFARLAIACQRHAEDIVALGNDRDADWRPVIKSISSSRDDYIQISCLAALFDRLPPGVKGERVIKKITEKFSPRSVIAAFFQSTLCPLGRIADSGHAASALLLAVLQGDQHGIERFKDMIVDCDFPEHLQQLLCDSVASVKPQPAKDMRPRLAELLKEALLLEPLPDKTLCLLIGLLSKDRPELCSAMDKHGFEGREKFLHSACAEVLSPLACHAIWMELDRKGRSLLHRTMAGNHFAIARPYLERICNSDIGQDDKTVMLEAKDGDGNTALAVALMKGQGNNVRGFIEFVCGKGNLKVDYQRKLVRAWDGTNRPGLYRAMELGNPETVAEYVGTVLRMRFDEEDKFSLLAAQIRKEGKTHEPPLRFALVHGHPDAVRAYVQAVLTSKHLKPEQKKDMVAAAGSQSALTLNEFVLQLRVDALKDAYREARKALPEAKSRHWKSFTSQSATRKLPSSLDEANALQRNEFYDWFFSKDLKFPDLEKVRKLVWNATEQEKQKRQAGLLGAMHAGSKAAVAAYIEAVAMHWNQGLKKADAIDLILAKDGNGEPAFYNIMENGPHTAVAAYVEAVWESGLPVEAKKHLLLACDSENRSAFNVAMKSGSANGVEAFMLKVLALPGWSGDQKKDEDLLGSLLYMGTAVCDGKTPRAMIAEGAERQARLPGSHSPGTSRAKPSGSILSGVQSRQGLDFAGLVQLYDRIIKASSLSPATKIVALN